MRRSERLMGNKTLKSKTNSHTHTHFQLTVLILQTVQFDFVRFVVCLLFEATRSRSQLILFLSGLWSHIHWQLANWCHVVDDASKFVQLFANTIQFPWIGVEYITCRAEKEIGIESDCLFMTLTYHRHDELFPSAKRFMKRINRKLTIFESQHFSHSHIYFDALYLDSANGTIGREHGIGHFVQHVWILLQSLYDQPLTLGPFGLHVVLPKVSAARLIQIIVVARAWLVFIVVRIWWVGGLES
jgi:hypothetical protein